MSRVTCFMLIKLPAIRKSLRRYTSLPCLGKYKYHDASVNIGEEDKPIEESTSRNDKGVRHDDSRWPLKCDYCTFEFRESDQWQVVEERLFGRVDDEDFTTILKDAPPGAMWNANWYSPDDLNLFVMLPDGNEWFIDGPSSNGNGWTRTGIPPKITARPSIQTPNYHGFLTDGVLISV